MRHELDALVPAPVISAEPAMQEQLPALAEIAKREIPGVNAKVGLARFLRADPESIFTFRRGDRLLGGIAFLYFNCRGHDALLLDNVDLKNPDREFLAESFGDLCLGARGLWPRGHGNSQCRRLLAQATLCRRKLLCPALEQRGARFADCARI